MSNLLEEIAIAAQKMKKDRFPDHVCAQANRISKYHLKTCDLADVIKFNNYGKELIKPAIKQSLIQTAAACIVMISELEK